jgi:hypothetical protein
MGEESIGRWGVMVRLEVFTELLRAAGYGSPEPDHRIDDDPHEATDQEQGPSAAEDDAQPAAEGESRPIHGRKRTRG